MTTYRIYLVDHADKTQSIHIMDLTSDAVALLEAGSLLRENRTGGSTEIWAGERIVGRISAERKSA